MAKIFSVSNADQLMSALASAQGGDTVELAEGNYGELSLIAGREDFNVKFPSEVTLRSADPDRPASFSEMNLQGVSNLTIDGVVFDYKFSLDDPSHINPFSVSSGSDHITIRNSVFDGDLASDVSEISDGFGYGRGLYVRNASNVSIENNEFFNWHRGAVFSNIEDLSVTKNDVHAIRSDGFDFIEVKSVLIEGNYIHDFSAPAGSSDHRDMIQFWTAGTDTPSVDVIIRDNVLDIGTGAWAQSIFMRNEEVDSGRSGSEMFYQNILIENNTIYNGHTHGITVGETTGLTVKNNSVLQALGGLNDLTGGVSIPKIMVKSASTSVVIQDNITSSIDGAAQQSDWSVRNNVLIQPADYLEHFITSTTDFEPGGHDFTALPFGPIEVHGAGSSHLQFSYAPENITAQFQVNADETSETSLILDASLTVGPLGPISENDAKFLWTFEDGSKASGRVIKYDFAKPGYHDILLSVVLQDGTTSQAQFTAGIAGSDIVQFDAQSGQFMALAYGEELALNTGDLPLSENTEGYTLKLGGGGSKADIPAAELSSFFGADAFEISMSLKADGADSRGEIARIHTSLTTGVDANGNFILELFLDDGSRVKLSSSGVSLNDGNFHNITARFDGQVGFAEILIDGQVVASETVSGSLGGGARSLMFGNPWGKQNFDGELSAFVLSADSDHFSAYEGLAEVITAPKVDTTAPEADTTAPEADTTAPEADTTAPEADTTNDSTTLPEEDAGLTPSLIFGGYKLDIAKIPGSDAIQLHDHAKVISDEYGQALSFDGKKDYVSVGRLTEFEASERIAFTVDFTSDSSDSKAQRLVWNHMKFGLTLEGDGIRVHAANSDNPNSKGFKIDNLGLNDGDRHSASVMVDAETDRLQVLIDGDLIFDEHNTDFDFVGAGGREWGWSLGTAWNRWFDGEVYDFQVSDDFSFVETGLENSVLIG